MQALYSLNLVLKFRKLSRHPAMVPPLNFTFKARDNHSHSPPLDPRVGLSFHPSRAPKLLSMQSCM